MVMVRVYVVTVRKFVNQDLTRILIKKYFFSNRVTDRWISLDKDTVDAPKYGIVGLNDTLQVISETILLVT